MKKVKRKCDWYWGGLDNLDWSVLKVLLSLE